MYPDTTAVNYTYDNDSHLTQVTDPTGTYGSTFDNMGRLTGTTTQYAFLPSRAFRTSYSYDAMSNRTGFTDPEGGASTYVYDTLNRLQTLTPASAISSGSFGISYDALGRRTGLTRPNAVNSTYSYDNRSHLLSVLHQVAGTTIDGATYILDAAGNRTVKTDGRTGATTNYGYDPIYELLSATQGGNATESYSYDPVGNRLSSLGVSPYGYNASNELTSTPSGSYTYDNNGNTLTDPSGKAYTWGFENRLNQVALPGSSGTVTFMYDPFGRRIQKSGPSGTTNYLYDGGDLIEEVDQSGSALARYTQGPGVDQPFAELRSGTTSYYQQDGLGSVTSLSSPTGVLANTYAYDSYGDLISSTGTLTNPFQYAGRESDSETGLYYNRARYYDQHVGRFLSEDPAGFLAGTHFYGYVGNNPTNDTDPRGLWGTRAHSTMIWNALKPCGVSGKDIWKIQEDSADWDEWTGLGTDLAYAHSMRSRGQTPEEAINLRNNFIADQLRSAQGDYQSGRPGLNSAALYSFAIAIHAMMDSTSPAHVLPNGDPIMWCGVTGCWDDPTLNFRKHGDHWPSIERLEDVTPSIMQENVDAIRDAWEFMTGKKLCGCR